MKTYDYENTKTRKELEKVINDKIAEVINEHRERDHQRKKNGIVLYYYSLNYESVLFAPYNGYKLRELPNNKPLTLLKEKETHAGDFVAFVNIRAFNDDTDWITFFDINEEKKTIDACGALPHLGYAWKDARKDNGRLFIITNKNIKHYAEAIKKHTEREKNKITLTGGERWTLSPANIETFDRVHYRIFKEWHRLTAEELDASGYYLPLFRQKLKDRADQVRREKQQAQEEQRRADFIASDKSGILADIKQEQKYNKNAILKLLNYETIMQAGAVSLLGRLKDNIKELQKIADTLEKYARYNDPLKEIENDILSIKENYIIAITQFNESGRDWCGVGCYTVKGGEVVARYDWVGQADTVHAGEVVRCPVNLGAF